MADQFGVAMTEYADVAFKAALQPKFNYGCAVFLDTDRVNFQKEGYSQGGTAGGTGAGAAEEHLAVRGADAAAGATRHRLRAARRHAEQPRRRQGAGRLHQARVPDAAVHVHPHCGEAGAIGAALEALRVVRGAGTRRSSGIDAAIGLDYTTTQRRGDRCHFCPNACKRTFIDTTTPDGGTSRYIAGFSCENGTVESKEALKVIAGSRKAQGPFPEPGGLRGAARVPHFYAPEPLPDATARRSRDVAWSRMAAAACSAAPLQRSFSALQRRPARRRAACASACRAC